VIGYLAERKQDRNLASSWSAMALGSVIIYTFGAGWLAHKLNVPIATGDTNAVSLGVTPFLIGDLIKLLLAGALLPAVWAGVDRTK
jgi:biotin transport system substrate-specific component